MAQPYRIKIERCPFCGAELEKKTIKSLPTGEDVIFCYIHPMADCVLSWFEVFPKEIHLWNRRTEK